MAAFEAISAGCICDRFEVPVASLIREVSETSEARNIIELVMFSQRSVRCSPMNAS